MNQNRTNKKYIIIIFSEELADLQLEYNAVDLGIDVPDRQVSSYLKEALANATLSNDTTKNQVTVHDVRIIHTFRLIKKLTIKLNFFFFFRDYFDYAKQYHHFTHLC